MTKADFEVLEKGVDLMVENANLKKRITDLEERIRNTGFILSALACRLTHDSKNKELEKMAFSALKSLSEGGGETTRPLKVTNRGDGMIMVSPVDEQTKEGGGEVSDE